jgi:hypothetical protein
LGLDLLQIFIREGSNTVKPVNKGH